MKARPECYDCLVRLIRQAASLASRGDEAIRRAAEAAAMELLRREFSLDRPPASF